MVDDRYRHDESADQPVGYGQRRYKVVGDRPESSGSEHGEYDQRVTHLQTNTIIRSLAVNNKKWELKFGVTSLETTTTTRRIFENVKTKRFE